MDSAYFDTCVVSGIAKRDLNPATEAAVSEILRIYKNGKLGLVTSEITEQKYQKFLPNTESSTRIPTTFVNVPIVATYRSDSRLMLMGIGGTRIHPLYSVLKTIVPDEQDAVHLFQAAKNEVRYFLTTDRKTILRHAMNIRPACSVLAVSPLELVAKIKNGTE